MLSFAKGGRRRSPAARRGIAAREVVVIAVFAIFLLMVALMWVNGRRGESRRAACLFRQQQVSLAILQCEVTQQTFPGYAGLMAVDETDTRRPTGWVFPVLPYVAEFDESILLRVNEGEVDFAELAADPNIPRPYRWLYQQYGPAGPVELRGTAPHEDISLLVCPDDVSAARSAMSNQHSWVVNTGMADADPFGELPADWSPNGIFQDQFHEGAADTPLVSAEYLAEHDGAANTLMMSENVDARQWTDHDEALVGFIWNANLADGEPAPGDELLRINRLRGEADGSLRFARPSSYHVGGVNTVYASGSAQFMSEEIDWRVFAQLMSSWGEAAKLPGSEHPVPEAYR